MDRINEQEIEEIRDEIRMTEAWVKMHLSRDSLGQQLILAKLGDLSIQVGTGEVPDYFGL